jgi:hypothetical protein
LTILAPWADLLFNGPISILAAKGVHFKKNWGYIVGLMVCGIYLFDSGLVYITLIWQGVSYPLQLALPPIIEITFGFLYPSWIIRRRIFPLQPETN